MKEAFFQKAEPSSIVAIIEAVSLIGVTVGIWSGTPITLFASCTSENKPGLQGSDIQKEAYRLYTPLFSILNALYGEIDHFPFLYL